MERIVLRIASRTKYTYISREGYFRSFEKINNSKNDLKTRLFREDRENGERLKISDLHFDIIPSKPISIPIFLSRGKNRLDFRTDFQRTLGRYYRNGADFPRRLV